MFTNHIILRDHKQMSNRNKIYYIHCNHIILVLRVSNIRKYEHFKLLIKYPNIAKN